MVVEADESKGLTAEIAGIGDRGIQSTDITSLVLHLQFDFEPEIRRNRPRISDNARVRRSKPEV